MNVPLSSPLLRTTENNLNDNSLLRQGIAQPTRPRYKFFLALTLLGSLFAASAIHAQGIHPDGNGGPGWETTETGMSTSGSPSIYLSPVTFYIGVTPSTCGSNVPVAVYDAGTLIGTVTMSSSGTGTLITSSLAVGSHSITASYPGKVIGSTTCLSSNSSSDPVVQVVNPAPNYQGLLYPKYVVMDVIYSPPGSKSSVQYLNSTSIGNTNTNSSSFSNNVGYSIQVTNGGGIPSTTVGPSGSVTFTVTQSTDYTQTQNSSSTVTLNKSASLSHTTTGYATSHSPNGPPSPGRASDWDLIVLWLNPTLVYTAYPSIPLIQWNGYGWDPGVCNGSNCTFYGMDDFPVHVGCLNGDFQNDGNPNDATMCQGEQSELIRDWATGEGQQTPTTGASLTASGCPNSSNSPSICFDTQDAWNILYADPLAYNPDPNAQPYTYFANPMLLPATTPDGRYTQFCWNGNQPNTSFPCPNPLDYVNTYGTNFTLVQMNTQQQSQGGSSQIKAEVSVSEKTSTGFMSLFGLTTTYTESDTVTQSNTWLNTLSTTQTVSNTLNITPDSPNYASDQFAVYQDNLLGTFLMVPYTP